MVFWDAESESLALEAGELKILVARDSNGGMHE